VTSGGTTRIHLCGPLVIERGVQRLEDQLPARQGRLLFAYLVCNRHRPIRRDELVEAVWPGDAPAATDSALSALVSKVRRALGPDAIVGRETVRLDVGEAWIDVEVAVAAVHRAESAAAAGDWTRAWGPALTSLFIAERELLPSEDAPWIDDERARLADVRIRALEAYGTACLGLGDAELAGAVRAGRELVRLAPLRESGYQLFMRALAAQGNVAEALRAYTVLCDRLRDELGVAPCAATRAVHEQLVGA
jgi:DNA-binding SARP family transcriptional activator